VRRHPLSESWPPLRESELTALRESMAIGFDHAHPIVLHDGMILDGWHRYEAALAAGIQPRMIEYSGVDPAGYVISNHVGRRHLTPGERAEAVVRCREWATPADGAAVRDGDPGSNDPGSTNADMAAEAQVSVPTVKRAKEKVREERAVHVAQASGEYEWYTPAGILIRVRKALGGPIDLDPCSSDRAQELVEAAHYITAAQNALDPETFWMPETVPGGGGHAFVNPPYAARLIPQFADRLMAEIERGNLSRAIWLSNNATETAWAQRLLSASAAVCFPSTRIKFLTPALEPKQTPLQGQMLIGLTAAAEDDGAFRLQFEQAFSDLGIVL